jgi:hypothetical protein
LGLLLLLLPLQFLHAACTAVAQDPQLHVLLLLL